MIEYVAFKSAVRCFFLEPPENVPDVFSLLRYEDIRGTAESGLDVPSSKGKVALITSDMDVHMSSSRLLFSRAELVVLCLQNGSDKSNCEKELIYLERMRIEAYLNSNLSRLKHPLTINIVFALNEESRMDTEAQSSPDLLLQAVSRFIDMTNKLSEVVRVVVNARIVRVDKLNIGDEDVSDAFTDLEKALIVNDEDINLVVYIPSNLDQITALNEAKVAIDSSIGSCIQSFVSRKAENGLVVVNKTCDVLNALSDTLILQLREILDIPQRIKDSCNALEDDSVSYCSVPTINASTISSDALHQPVTPTMFALDHWEIRWIRMAMIESSVRALSKVHEEVNFHCDSVWDWSSLQHESQLLLEYYRSIVLKAKVLSHFLDEEPEFEKAYLLAIEIIDISSQILRGEAIQKPSYFPMEYRMAVYAPFWVPILLPIAQGVFVEYRRYRSHQISRNLG